MWVKFCAFSVHGVYGRDFRLILFFGVRFVSDIGLEGHQQLCQHKALQCANIEPQFSRVYPPCLLEWRAIQQKSNMALEASFPDGKFYHGGCLELHFCPVLIFVQCNFSLYSKF